MNIETLFYKTVEEFSKEYDINLEYVTEILTGTRFSQDSPNAQVLGMTELHLLKKLDLFMTVEGLAEKDDPRNTVYILYIVNI